MTAALRARLVAHALGLPEAWEDHPWGETVAKVGRKVFVFFGMDPDEADEATHLTVKLPMSHEEALALPFTEPAGYGLDRGNWVTVHAPADWPADMLLDWIEESYRAVAPKKLAQALGG
jgi:predicted DNA-binding protein (MmcQ/YjbR family)